MSTKLNLPYIKSRGWECGQACCAMVIKYKEPNFIPDFDEMNEVIHHKKGMYTFPPQLGILLNHYGVNAHVYSCDDIKTECEDPDQFKRWFGKDYAHEMKYIDLPTIDWMVGEMRKKDLFTVKDTKFSELISLFSRGNIVGFPLDWNTITGKGGPYHGHFMLIARIDEDNLLMHDPDIGPYQKYPISLIQKAWEHPAISQDYIVVPTK